VIVRQQPLSGPAILFGNRGARANATENTIEAFLLARRLGATGIETDLWTTADGVPVLKTDGSVGRMRRRRLVDVDAADLPAEIPTLRSFYEELGPDLDILANIRTPAAGMAAISVAEEFGAVGRLWLVSTERDLLREWRERSADVRLVDSTAPDQMLGGPERHAADLRQERIDGVALHQSVWHGGRVALFHRFARHCFAMDAPHERMIVALMHMGIDGVSSPNPDLLLDAAVALTKPDYRGPRY